MKALVLEAQGRLAQKECSVRQPDPDELLVKTQLLWNSFSNDYGTRGRRGGGGSRKERNWI